MKATVLQSNLAKALGHIARVVSNRAALPVLGNVLISAKNGRISLSATDLEIGITTQAAGKIEEEGELTVPARLLSDFVLNNGDDTIAISASKDKANFKSARFEANLNGISAEEFPTVPDAPKDSFCAISRTDFVDAVKKVIIAPAADETRPTLAGVYFQFQGKTLILAATDSYRLAEKRLKLKNEIKERKIIVPARTMAEVLRLASGAENISDITLSGTANQIFFTFGEITVVSRVIEGAFPNYAQIIPADFKISAKAGYGEFLAAVKMAAIFSKDAAKNIRIKTSENGLTVSSIQAETGNATSTVPAEAAGGEMQIAFNARYVLDMLQAAPSDKITLKLNDSSAPGLIECDKDKEYTYIVMPLKLE